MPGYPRLRVLDLSCGRGEILAALQRDGCTVRGTHYRADDYEVRSGKETFLSELAIDAGVELTLRLPYEDSAFDLVILSEVVEHLSTYIPVIHEAGRVLARGGHLLLSTPNIHRLHSRLHFFLTGTHKLIRERVSWNVSPEDLYAYHINPLDFPLAHTLLHQAGLRINKLRFTFFKRKHAWLFLLYPVFWLATRFEIRGRDEGERELARWMTHPAMLASEQLLIVARRH
ncbi:MAG TPA: class I SAM-dependent methyltransferase [Thermoanaerobaculia bacterium]|nr:class I SAM-dependent methyltransferase [Thermoanaerobaculia bacterium]